MFDCAIIGTGPAGLSAAINLKIHEKRFLWFGSRALSAKVALAEQVANYPGLPSITGRELAGRFSAHAEAMGLEITDKMVSQISHTRQGFALLAENDLYQADTLILAVGVVTARALPGEPELVGKGVSYCATCDGFLHRGKPIGIVCTDPRFEHEVLYLADLANKVYLFPSYPGCSVSRENVEIMEGGSCPSTGKRGWNPSPSRTAPCSP